MTYVVRDKDDPEQVMEDWMSIQLSHLPRELVNKRILGIFLKKQDVLFALLEGGVLASLKVEMIQDDYITALVLLDDDFFYGIIIPCFFAFVAVMTIYFKRR